MLVEVKKCVGNAVCDTYHYLAHNNIIKTLSMPYPYFTCLIDVHACLDLQPIAS